MAVNNTTKDIIEDNTETTLDGETEGTNEVVPQSASTTILGSDTVLSLELLYMVIEMQSHHGLKHNDHQRYRKYCSRRLHRLRKALRFQNSYKGKYRHKPIQSGSKLNDERFLHIPLVQAERCWAYAMELKVTAPDQSRHAHRLIRKLNKSVLHAKQLYELVNNSNTDTRAKLEAEAYRDWILGTVCLEQLDWEAAYSAFTSCRAIYENLSSVVPVHQQECYKIKVNQIDPGLRYCKYSIVQRNQFETGVNSTDGEQNLLAELRSGQNVPEMLSEKIEEVLRQTREKASSGVSEVNWLSHTIPVRAAKIHGIITRVQEDIQEVESVTLRDAKLKLYSRMLMDCQEALQAIKDEIGVEKKFKFRPEKENNIEDLNLLVDYVSYTKHAQGVNRNLLLVDQLKYPGPEERAGKPEELVRLYDILLQGSSEMECIRGIDDQILSGIQCRKVLFKTYRCYHLAEIYLSAQEWSKAIALLERTSDHVTAADNQIASLPNSTPLIPPTESQELQNLSLLIRSKRSVAYVSLSLGTNMDEILSKTVTPTRPIIEDLDKFVIFDKNVNLQNDFLIPFPPQYRAAACKPYFFDLALNHFTYPDLAKHYQQKEGRFTSLFKGLWSS